MSTTRSPSYLLQTPHTGCFYFRMRVPLDLQPCIGKKELRASLKTGYLADAKSKSRLIAGRVQQLFRKIRIKAKDNYDMTELDQAKINDIIRGFIKDSLDEEEARASGNQPAALYNQGLNLLFNPFQPVPPHSVQVHVGSEP